MIQIASFPPWKYWNNVRFKSNNFTLLQQLTDATKFNASNCHYILKINLLKTVCIEYTDFARIRES